MTLRRATGWAALGTVLIAALGAVFCAYLRPDMAMTLATQLWNCL
jgi:hypothetical protein